MKTPKHHAIDPLDSEAYWNENVILTKFPSLTLPEVLTITTSGATKFVETTTFSSQVQRRAKFGFDIVVEYLRREATGLYIKMVDLAAEWTSVLLV